MTRYRGVCCTCHQMNVLDMPYPHGRCARCDAGLPELREPAEPRPPMKFHAASGDPHLYFGVFLTVLIAELLVELARIVLR